MKITREQVEQWIEEKRIELGLYVFSIGSTEWNDSALYTAHPDESACVAASASWEYMLDELAEYRSAGPEYVREELERSKKRTAELEAQLKEMEGEG